MTEKKKCGSCENFRRDESSSPNRKLVSGWCQFMKSKVQEGTECFILGNIKVRGRRTFVETMGFKGE